MEGRKDGWVEGGKVGTKGGGKDGMEEGRKGGMMEWVMKTRRGKDRSKGEGWMEWESRRGLENCKLQYVYYTLYSLEDILTWLVVHYEKKLPKDLRIMLFPAKRCASYQSYLIFESKPYQVCGRIPFISSARSIPKTTSSKSSVPSI